MLLRPQEYGPTCLHKDSKIEIRLTGVLQDEEAAIVGSYTTSHLHSHGVGSPVHNTYHRVRFGFTKAKEGDRFPIADLASSEWLRGWGLTGGYEFGRTFPRSWDSAYKGVTKYLDQAKKDCIADKLGEAGISSLGDAQSQCQGEQLNEWMGSEDRREKYYEAFNAAALQPDKVRALYGGINGSVAFPQFTFVPDTHLPAVAVTGQPTKPQDISVKHTAYELRAYAGGYTTKHFALEFGVSHRKTFEQADKRTLCPIGSTGFLECWELRTEPPSELHGFVADARAALWLDLPILPTFGILASPSYEFDAHRWNASGSLFFATDDDGKLTSGISLRCKGAGHDRLGKPLDKDCKAEIFVSSSFSLRPPH